jgi:hypothetical protein
MSKHLLIDSTASNAAGATDCSIRVPRSTKKALSRNHHSSRHVFPAQPVRSFMQSIPEPTELLGLVWRPARQSFRLRVNDVIRVNGRLGRIVRVSESSAVVLLNRPARAFTTRFDKQVRFQPAPITLRISPNAETEIVNRTTPNRKKRKPR